MKNYSELVSRYNDLILDYINLFAAKHLLKITKISKDLSNIEIDNIYMIPIDLLRFDIDTNAPKGLIIAYLHIEHYHSLRNGTQTFSFKEYLKTAGFELVNGVYEKQAK